MADRLVASAYGIPIRVYGAGAGIAIGLGVVAGRPVVVRGGCCASPTSIGVRVALHLIVVVVRGVRSRASVAVDIGSVALSVAVHVISGKGRGGNEKQSGQCKYNFHGNSLGETVSQRSE